MPRTTRRTKKASQQTAELICIQAGSESNVLSPTQRRFNSLIKKIDKEKKKLKQWQETYDFCKSKVLNEMHTAIKELAGCQSRMVFLIDAHLKDNRFTKRQHEKIKKMICDLAEQSLEVSGDNQELQAIYDRYLETDGDDQVNTSEEDMVEQMKILFKEVFNVDLDDDDIPSDPESRKRMFEEFLNEESEETKPQKRKRKKTAKQLEKAAKKKQEEEQLHQSIRAIYRELVTSLHPDREQDQQEKERKTQLMKLVTVAYKKQDLLQLLELQLQVEQIDQQKINGIAEERLKHYNTFLQNQLTQIQVENECLIEEIMVNSGQFIYFKPSPDDIKAIISESIFEVQNCVENLMQDIDQFQDVKKFKEFLNKSYNKR